MLKKLKIVCTRFNDEEIRKIDSVLTGEMDRSQFIRQAVRAALEKVECQKPKKR
jgi:metal-responsive CopG/Arc/MetJ family transcriptional regulator